MIAATSRASSARPAIRAQRRTVKVSAAMKVAVTGAGGRTGGLCVKELAAKPDRFAPVPIARSAESAAKVEASNGLPAGTARVLDIAANDPAAAAKALEGCDALIIATSAVPELLWWSIPVMLVKKALKMDGARPSFRWKQGQTPEQVDWLGQKLQIDAALKAGVKRVVVIGSMGGTQPDNMLNKLVGEDGGNILLWKRRAEQYLIASGLEYTVIHPGGLIDKPGGRVLAVDVDDALLARKVRSIPRADVAALAVACVDRAATRNRAFDAVAEPEDSEAAAAPKVAPGDWDALLATLGDRTCDYSINSQLPAATPVGAAAASGSK